jgi:4-amino-4-deoxy-L-arabinose transferase-like glycosyltransferase
MTKLLFVIISIIYFSLTAIFAGLILRDGLITLGLSVACLAILAWALIKIKYEYEGFKPPKRKRGPQTF